jgi:hypothetical protein
MRILLCLCLVGCGGMVVGPLVDGGETEASNAASDSITGETCSQLLDDLSMQQTAATHCCTTCGSPQCTMQLEGLCCPLTVTDTTAATAYETTLMKVKVLACATNCPGIACSVKATGMCLQTGTCQQ